MEASNFSDGVLIEIGEIKRVESEHLKIFNSGTVMSIKYQSVFEPVLSVIQKVEGNRIYFKLPHMFLKHNVLEGDHVECHILTENFEYVIYSVISAFEINNYILVEAIAEKIKRFENTRKTKRYLVSFPATIFYKGYEKDFYAVIKNISINGMGAIFKEELQLNTPIDVIVHALIEDGHNLRFKSRIARITKRELYNEYGLEITEINKDNKNILEKLIFRLESDEAEFVSWELR